LPFPTPLSVTGHRTGHLIKSSHTVGVLVLHDPHLLSFLCVCLEHRLVEGVSVESQVTVFEMPYVRLASPVGCLVEFTPLRRDVSDVPARIFSLPKFSNAPCHPELVACSYLCVGAHCGCVGLSVFRVTTSCSMGIKIANAYAGESTRVAQPDLYTPEPSTDTVLPMGRHVKYGMQQLGHLE
jgi:hypothetical protein